VFEIPFQRYRGWDALSARLRQVRPSRSIVDNTAPAQSVD
jgi:hypothetical protein